ncbi:GPW/gp25 family protein [Marinimicrobium locisalis]|uniref:GPW/gp25 family protein n=1 Tax=Marinimicrobium locisalis TaxID=546022 RepID=UPI003221D77E
MKERKDRGWAFRLPVAALGSEPVTGVEGPTLNPRGGIATVEGVEAVRQSILLLLATRPGERVMRPDYGCWLHRLVFAPNDAGTAGLAMHYIRQAVERWEPRAQITHLIAGADLTGVPDPGMLQIFLEFRVRRDGHKDQLALGYALNEARLIDLHDDSNRGELPV